jgi:hypothetical protein
MVKAVVLNGKKTGSYLGRVAVRASGFFNVQTSTGVIQGISNKACRSLQRADGYNYSLIAHTPEKESETGGVLRTPRYPSPA